MECRREKSKDRISEYPAALGVLTGQIRVVDEEIIEKSRSVREAFEGFSTSHQVSDFVKTGIRPTLKETGGKVLSKAERFRKNRERELSELV